MALTMTLDPQIYSANERLRSLRGEFVTAVSDSVAGSSSIRKVFGNLIDRIYLQIDELLTLTISRMVPENRLSEYNNSTAYITEFADFDDLVFYNGLLKLKWKMYEAKLAVFLMADVPAEMIKPSVAYTLDSGMAGVLDDTEFLEQGPNAPVIDRRYTYDYYTIRQGDTLPSIAAKQFNGDSSRWYEIARVNEITNDDLLDDGMIGRTIKIPLSEREQSEVRAGNPVFERIFTGTDPRKIAQYLYGRDLKTVNRTLQISSDGDLATVSGIDCVMANILDRFKSRLGSLNPLHPEWGIPKPINNTRAPFPVHIDRMIRSLEEQAEQDRRVSYAKADLNTLRLEGDGFRIDIDVRLIGDADIQVKGEILL